MQTNPEQIGKQPQALCSITEKERTSFKNYLEQVAQIINAQKVFV